QHEDASKLSSRMAQEFEAVGLRGVERALVPVHPIAVFLAVSEAYESAANQRLMRFGKTKPLLIDEEGGRFIGSQNALRNPLTKAIPRARVIAAGQNQPNQVVGAGFTILRGKPGRDRIVGLRRQGFQAAGLCRVSQRPEGMDVGHGSGTSTITEPR